MKFITHKLSFQQIVEKVLSIAKVVIIELLVCHKVFIKDSEKLKF